MTSKSDEKNSDPGATSSSNPDHPTSAVGNGREDVDVRTTEEGKKNDSVGAGTRKFKSSISIPIPRIPKWDELPASGLPDPGLFFTTIVIPVPTFGGACAEFNPQPQPTPAPRPALRTLQQAPPAVDSGGGGVGGGGAGGVGGGGADPLSAGFTAEPPVLRAPMVIAPLPIPLPRALPPVAPPGATAGAGPAPVITADVAAAGARAPVIRGSLPPSAEPAATSGTPTLGQATPLDYVRSLREPTPGELALVALPGAVGLLVFTFSGGVIGYRQANSVRFLRAQTAARFLR